jgi:GNAT superfamily N-acetyltransferase
VTETVGDLTPATPRPTGPPAYTGKVATSTLTGTTLAERPDLTGPLRESGLDGTPTWPRFYEGNEVSRRFWDRMYSEFADYQIVLVDGSAIVACGHTVPLYWDQTVEGLPQGWDQGFERAFQDKHDPNTLMAVSAAAKPAVRNTGLGSEILQAMRALARERGFNSLVAPVRPNRKESYPLAKFEEYINWNHADGSAFDPWLRTHMKLGGRILRVATESMVVEGSVEQWSSWTGGSFPASGAYVVPGALTPVHIDVEADRGRYVEPNVWVEHRITPDQG